jgi:hypothetical protein
MRRTVPISMMLALVPAAWGQQVVSARAGLIQYVEGRVLLNDQAIAPKVNEFLQVEKGQTLATEEGRVEVLLTPGAFLRLSENSSFRMISSDLSDTRLEVLSGSALVEVDDLFKENAITLQAGNATVSLKKHGLYRMDAEGGQHFRVYDGEALVTSADQTINAKKGREVEVGETLTASKFDADQTDPFYRWSERRAGYIATANVSSARSVMGGGYTGYGSGLGYLSSWTYNPWFGMYTFVPATGFGYSPFGYALYSPVTVRYVTVQPTSFVAATAPRTVSAPTARSETAIVNTRGMGGGGSAPAGNSVGRSAPAASSAPAATAAPASVGRSAGGGGGGARGR